MRPDPDTFQLRPLRPFRLSDKSLEKKIRRLDQIHVGPTPHSGKPIEDKVEKLRQRMRAAAKRGWTSEVWHEATNVRRRTWTLLHLYILELGTDAVEEWLPELNADVANSIFERDPDPATWHRARKRQVTGLFFIQFDRIECLPLIGQMLRTAWSLEERTTLVPAAATWAEHILGLFSDAGPEYLANHWRPGETVIELLSRFHIPETSRFRDCLIEAMHLRRLEHLELWAEDKELFTLLEKDRELEVREGRLLGSRVVEILVKRVIVEAGGAWKRTWSRRLVPFACDPRVTNHTERQRLISGGSLDCLTKALTELQPISSNAEVRSYSRCSTKGSSSMQDWSFIRIFTTRFIGASARA
jgi:hypothetical protein